MKKLNLGKLMLASEEVLQRSQLAGIYGGSGAGCLDIKCGTKHPAVCCPQTHCSDLESGFCVVFE